MLSVRMRPEGTPRKDRRASKACSGCRTRKVRCDVLTSGIPCSNCRADQFECSILPRKKRATKSKKQREGNWAALNTTISDDSGSLVGVAPAGHVTQHIARHQIPHYPLLRDFTEGNDGDESASADGQASLGAASTITRTRQVLPSLSQEDMQYMTLKGAFDVPPKQVLNDLVSNYFRVFHPFFPVVDKRAFLQQYDAATAQDRFNQHGISLLLLQTIIFTSCASIDASVISSMKFTSRKQARAVFHSRARCLYEFDYEKDSIVSVQALLLMSHHYPSMTDQKHTWFWAQQAIGLAQGAGLHRDPGPVSQRKHWARIWWTCLSRDRLIAIGTGRPMHINSLDCDVPMLTLDDLAEDGDDDDIMATKTTFIELIKLCQYMECILPLHITKSTSDKSLEEQVGICQGTLQRWLDHLPVAAQLDQPTKASPGLIFPIYRAVLHMIYNIVVIALYQSHQAAPNYTPSESRLPHPRVQVAAQNITELAERLMELDVVKLCPTICVTSILSSLIVHLLMQHFSLEKENCASGASFGICLNFISELSDIYWHAGFYHDLFKLAFKTQGNRTTPLLDNDKHSVLAFLQETTKNGKATKQPRLATPEISTADDIVEESQTQNQPRATSTAYESMVAEATGMAPSQEVTDTDAVAFASEFEYPSLDNSNIDSALFEDWLNECGYYYNSLPSA